MLKWIWKIYKRIFNPDYIIDYEVKYETAKAIKYQDNLDNKAVGQISVSLCLISDRGHGKICQIQSIRESDLRDLFAFGFRCN